MSTKYIVNNVTGQTINGQTFVPSYKVYTALLTQSGSNIDTIVVDNAPLTIGVTYQIIDDGGGGWDFTNVGAPNNSPNTYFVATGTEANSWGSGGWLESALAIPVVTVLENTIGNIWFIYIAEGVYQVQSNNLFTINKTWFSVNSAVYDNNGPINQPVNTTANSFDDSLGINVYGVDGANSLLSNTPIEIRVYN
jgi:hypothetical protein